MEVTLELSDLVVMQSKYIISHIFDLKKLVAGLSVAKNLIEYNSKNSEENEEEKEPIYIEFTVQKVDPEIMKMQLTLNDRMYKKTRKKLLFSNFI